MLTREKIHENLQEAGDKGASSVLPPVNFDPSFCRILPPRVFYATVEKVPLEFCNGAGFQKN